MAVLQNKIQEFTTIAAMIAMTTQPFDVDKFYCEETNEFYDYDPLYVPNGTNILALTNFSGGLKIASNTGSGSTYEDFEAAVAIESGKALRLSPTNGLVYPDGYAEFDY